MDEFRIVAGGHFVVGRRQLNRHFDLDASSVSVLTFPSQALREQLCLRDASEFESGRVPLYACECGDLACGALTVKIEGSESTVTWSDFGWEGTSSSSHSPSPYMERTGPFTFDRRAYLDAIDSFGT